MRINSKWRGSTVSERSPHQCPSRLPAWMHSSILPSFHLHFPLSACLPPIHIPPCLLTCLPPIHIPSCLLTCLPPIHISPCLPSSHPHPCSLAFVPPTLAFLDCNSLPPTTYPSHCPKANPVLNNRNSNHYSYSSSPVMKKTLLLPLPLTQS